ncbi:9024_t:CDS:2 [Dentiscutata erythropus]|uniref:9024_t:CDS:1 n=1 Tax=Dentiscutata erythropus TaxID=1348616 RepID=A0A9N9FWG7_9GLOM|nr:9024_t:CDS:2 [Dentiscutata erythropus]
MNKIQLLPLQPKFGNITKSNKIMLQVTKDTKVTTMLLQLQQIDLENNNISSQVFLLKNESNNDIVSPQVSSPDYGNNETHSVSSTHKNNEATLSYLVSFIYEDNVLWENNISLPDQRSAQFQQVDNKFEIALWIICRKRILDLATNIRNGMTTRIDDNKKHVTTLMSSISYESSLKLPEINQLQEECKTLFLQTKNNSTILYKEIIVKITKADPSAKKPYNELDEFVTNNIWKQLLQISFVYQVIKAVLIVQDKYKNTQTAIRKCDKYTIDLEISTKFEIVKLLPVRELLDY